MSTTVGEVKIAISFDKKSLSSGLSEVEKETESASSNLSSKFSSAAKVAGAAIVTGLAAGTAAIASLAKSAVEAYADYEQLTGGVETLFGASASTVEAYADTAYKTAGLSANAYMETVTSFSASLLQGLGGDTAAAAEYANLAVTDMADNANKMGTSMDLIQNAYQGFAKQNYTMLDNLKLGYGGTQAEMARLINDSGVLGDTMTVTAETVNSVSFDKMVEAIHVIQTEMGITGTTAAEAADTISGSFSSMSSAWTNVLASFGTGSDEAIMSAIDGLIESAGNFMSNIVKVLPNVVNGIIQLINALIPQIPVLLNQLLPPLLSGAVTLITGLVNALPSLITPENIQLIVNAGLQLFMGLVQALPQIVQALAESLPTIIDTLVAFLSDPETIQTLLETAVLLFFAIVEAVPKILGSLIGAFGTLVGNLWTWITQRFGQFAASFGEFLAGIFKNAINGVLSFIENFINGPIDLINGFIGLINGAFGVIGVNIGTIGRISLPRLAEGGITMGATTAIIGEAGQEAVLPLERNTGNWSGLLASALAEEFEEQSLGSGVTINQTNYINSDVDIDKVEQGLATALRRVSL